jgi:PAS domain S-box-containing protein
MRMASLPLPDPDRPGDPLAAAADWAKTPLGPVEDWDRGLRFAADLCLRSALPSALFWGPERLVVRNEAWHALLGGAQGVPGAEALAEVWPVMEPLIRRVEETGEGAFLQEQPLAVRRDGVDTELYWNCNLLPLTEAGGAVAGVLAQANDVTRTVTAERRLSFQISLADRLRRIGDPEEVKRAATELLGRYLDVVRVGYGEVDEAHDSVAVHSDWTRDSSILSLAGQKGVLSSFGKALGLLKAGETLAISDLHAVAEAEGWAPWDAIGVRALVTAPIIKEGVLKGLLYVHEPEPRCWTRAEAAIVRDVAERTGAAVARAQAEQSLRDSEDHYRHTVELNPLITWTALPDGRVHRIANRWRDWTGTDGLAGGWREAMHPDDVEATLAQWARSLETGEPYDVEHRIRHLDQGYRWARTRAFPRRDADGNILLWYATTEDIHEAKTAEERQRLLINELNHRVKNTLATVQAIAFQTLRGDIGLAEGRARFEGRLMALSRAHNLLTEQNWGGAALERVVRDATEPLGGEQGRFDLDGAPLWLTPRASLALALALHELATNAAKYGALSADEGRVSIAWRTEGDRLLIDWKEMGGPPVTRPVRRGFGSRLIEQGLGPDLGGTAELAFEPDGLRCTIAASLDALRAEEGSLG